MRPAPGDSPVTGSTIRWRALAALAVLGLLAAVSGCTASSEPAFANPKVHSYVMSALQFMDTYGINAGTAKWRTTREETIRKTAKATSYQQTYGALMIATWAAGGSTHSSFHSAEGTKDIYKALGDGDQLPTVSLTGDVSTVMLPTHESEDPAKAQTYANTAANAITQLGPRTSCGWIVDLRQDDGGNVYPMLAAVSPLLTQGRLVSFVHRDGAKSWITLERSSVVYQATASTSHRMATANVPGSSFTDHPVAVLQGPYTGSSGEAVLLAFTSQKNVRTFGQITAGLASGNVAKTMPDGATITLTSSWDSNRNGTRTYPHGIPPTVATSVGADTVTTATTWLHDQCNR